jgi:hypothetical protein
MKHKVTCLLLVILLVSLSGCSEDPINKIIIQNSAAGDISLNFKGSIVDVPSGSTVELKDIDHGEYEYETIFSIPVGATDFESDGEMSGTFILGAGTNILVVYTSVFDQEGKYSIYASVTTSDNLNADWWENIINPINP